MSTTAVEGTARTSPARAKAPRPKVRFMTPAELRGHQEVMWALHDAMIQCDRGMWMRLFEQTARYAVYWVGGEIVGFSSVMEAELTIAGRRVFTIGLGQAVVAPAYRNHFLVQRALIFRWVRHFIRHPLQPIYIWGNCVSYKSYLSFVKVLKVVYPRAGQVPPAHHAAVIDALGRHWYGREYDSERKVVVLRDFAVREAQAAPADLADPDIAYYCQGVPQLMGETAGLLTISPCIRSNFLPMVTGWARNFVRKALGLRRKRA